MSEEKKDKDILFVAHTRMASIASDIFEATSLLLVVIIAYWLDSGFISVTGALLWLALFMAKGIGYSNRNRKTPQEAANYLKQEYGVTAE